MVIKETPQKFELVSDYSPAGDQPEAIKALSLGVAAGMTHQVLLGVTGSGKTFTIANVIEKTQRPTLVISHNKTLAGQLTQEFREFFPKNAVEYFVSYYDYYQPEAYIPHSDTYIAKETSINDQIDKLRLAATTSIMTRRDVVVVASVSCIYNLGNPVDYGEAYLEVGVGQRLQRDDLLSVLVRLHYTRLDSDLKRSCFRVRGNFVEVVPAYSDDPVRFEFVADKLVSIQVLEGVTGNVKQEQSWALIYSAKHYVAPEEKIKRGLSKIQEDLEARLREFELQGKQVEAYRLRQRTEYDVEMLSELGYCQGIENYSRYFDGREAGQPPYTLMDFFSHRFGKDWLLVVDESHMTIPQIRGMYNGDAARKKNLVDYGFRLPAAFDNRPLKFAEFLRKIPPAIYISATPSDWEIQQAQKSYEKQGLSGRKYPKKAIVEQLVRPTGLVDPSVEVLPSEGQIDNLVSKMRQTIANGQRVLVTTMTKRMAEDLSIYLEEQGFKVTYLHSEIDTLERSDILADLRGGKYDVLVGINLLREGLDLPEVSLVAILDADKEGFLRSDTSLIQVMGRAARHVQGKVVMYADTITGSMRRALDEVARRRQIQLSYNRKHKITSRSIVKPVRERLIAKKENILETSKQQELDVRLTDFGILPPPKQKKIMADLEKEMRQAAEELDFETAAILRDKIKKLYKLL